MDDIAKTVMGVFKAFGANQNKIKVRLTKLADVEGRVPKLPVDMVIEGMLASEIKPGVSFNIVHAQIMQGESKVKNIHKGKTYELFCTSIIQKMIDENTFETKNSIYKWEKL